MKPIFVILMILSALAYSVPSSKAPCQSIPVCFSSALPGSNYCATHQNQPTVPIPKQCVYFISQPYYRCYNMAVQGSDLCTTHYLPDLSAKAVCANPVPVCFATPVSGSSYCANHQRPAPKLCYYPTGTHAPYTPCQNPVDAGGVYCSLHSHKDIVDTVMSRK